MGFDIGIKGIRQLFPEYYLDMLYEIYTPKEVDSILKSYVGGRRTTFRINKLKAPGNKVIEELKKRNIKFEKCPQYDDIYMLKDSTERILQGLESYKNGEIYLQNLSSIMPAEVLEVDKNDKVLDMCAAPGGKTLKLAEKMNNEGEIIANEVNGLRYERLKYNIIKQGAKNITAINLDGRRLMKSYPDYFDKILLDVPCSGEGTIKIRNNKKIKLLKNGPFVKVQKELIKSAFNSLKSSGVILYSTCTIAPEENEEIIDYLLSKYPNADLVKININLINIKNGIVSYKDKKYDERMVNAVRIIPNDAMEGFFIAMISKK